MKREYMKRELVSIWKGDLLQWKFQVRIGVTDDQEIYEKGVSEYLEG